MPCTQPTDLSFCHTHSCLEAPNIINIFSFSKSYGLMGWRVGFLAFDTTSDIGEQLMKVQDTIPICPTIIRWEEDQILFTVCNAFRRP